MVHRDPLWFTELRRASITSVTEWALLVPVVGVILGVVVLGECITVAEGIGDAIMVAALALVAYADRASRRDAAGDRTSAVSRGHEP